MLGAVAQGAGQAVPGQAVPAQATVRGIVRNAMTGKPVVGAQVKIEGETEIGGLTDEAGRFEISGVPVGAQTVTVSKSGFFDRGGSFEVDPERGFAGPVHHVQVALEMPDLAFTLEPTSVLHGHIDLSTGGAAVGIEVELLRQTVQDGRAVWQPAGETTTGGDGSYRFEELQAGVYALYTQPAMANEPAAKPGNGGAIEHWGCASIFYPDARDLAGAAKIQLAADGETQADLTLAVERFYPVTSLVVLPDGRRYGDTNPAWEGMNLTALVLDAEENILPYMPQYDQESKTVQGLLPAGIYSLLVTVTTSRFTASVAGNNTYNPAMDAGPYTGMVGFTVAGHEVSMLRIASVVARGGPVQSRVVRTTEQSASEQSGGVMLTISQAGGWIDDGMISAFASGSAPGPLETTFTLPGSYWVHTQIGQKGLCEASFTAGSANLAREPVQMGLTGSTEPMELTLRDGCARLTLHLPRNLAAPAAGEETYYTVYAVPDFDFTGDLAPIPLRASTGGTATLDDLTPGSYHVYTFAGSMDLEYRNPAVMAGLSSPGQAVTLFPGASRDLVLEIPGP
jgi:hypothetical protein